MTDEAKKIASQMHNYIADFAADRIDYTTAERAIEDLDRKFRAIHGRSYYAMMGYQTMAAFIYQRWD